MNVRIWRNAVDPPLTKTEATIGALIASMAITGIVVAHGPPFLKGRIARFVWLMTY